LRVPRATYRLQLSRDLTFSDVAGLAAYLAVLGVSDLYASPLMRARPGSTHGVSFARLHGEGAAITVAPRLYARLTGGDGPLIPAPEIWADTSIRLPERLAGATYRNVLTGERAVIEEREGETLLPAGAWLRGFPVALLEARG
jgi:maltooligosyltrehalose synthase